MIIKCKMCGGDLAFEEGNTVCECEYCGSKQTIPIIDNEKKANFFNRANRLRMNSEFDKASAVYESIVAEFPEEAEAYWGLCLCNYGIEYVDDPATGKKLPTCHRTMTGSIMEDSNFEQACDYADSVARKMYRDEAKAIDRIQKDILSIAANEAPYDVFICYKETADEGGRTEDSVLAQDIYDALTAKGMKVFFSRITLEDKLGVQYEPYIFAALSSAKVMLAIGTQFEYYDAVWVKNEWSRFLSMMKTDKSKTLIPCFKGLDAYDMPKEFKGLQAQDMGKLGWLQDLVRGVEKLCGKGGSTPQVVQTSSNSANLMQRVYLFLEDEDWDQAAEYINRVLDTDAKYAPAYVACVLVDHELTAEADLAKLRDSIDDDANWKKALRFADAQQKKTYEAYAKAINANQAYDEEQDQLAAEKTRFEAEHARDQVEKSRLEYIKARLQMGEKARHQAEENVRLQACAEQYATAGDAKNRKNYPAAIIGFHALGDYRDSPANLRICMDAYRRQLQAGKVKPGIGNPELKAARDKVYNLEQQMQKAQRSVDSAKASIAELVQREQAIPTEIQRLGRELCQVRGLFSGVKKRELETKIEALKRELSESDSKKQESSASAETNQKKLTSLVNGLASAKAELQKTEENIATSALKGWTDDAVIAAATAAVAKQAFTKVGNIVTYGHYEQNHNTANGKEAIEWIVLTYDSATRRSLLISRYGLDAHYYHKAKPYPTWKKSDIRTWMNGTFLNAIFTSEEQLSIVPTKVSTPDYSGNRDGSDTEDQLWLLSLAEAKTYFNGDAARKCVPTAHAVNNGAHRSNVNELNGKACCWWWLRSPGDDSISASCVQCGGGFSSSYVYYMNSAVRPAFWLDLDSAAI